jgi:acyl-CoA thioester hydrolase
MKIFTHHESVRYAETDRMKVVHHSTYLYWFEVGRTGLLGEAGYPYHELEASGTIFPVIEFSCRLVGSADYGDRVRIETHIIALRSRSCTCSYAVFNRDGLIAAGTTLHVCVNTANKTHRLPGELLEALQSYVAPKTGSESR